MRKPTAAALPTPAPAASPERGNRIKQACLCDGRAEDSYCEIHGRGGLVELLKDILINETCFCAKTVHRPCPRCQVTLDEVKELIGALAEGQSSSAPQRVISAQELRATLDDWLTGHNGYQNQTQYTTSLDSLSRLVSKLIGQSQRGDEQGERG